MKWLITFLITALVGIIIAMSVSNSRLIKERVLFKDQIARLTELNIELEKEVAENNFYNKNVQEPIVTYIPKEENKPPVILIPRNRKKAK